MKRSRSSRTIFAAVALGLIVGCALRLPENTPVERAVWLDQNWPDEERFWFHHANQGTATLPVPYPWFVALEQPGISWFGAPGRLSDPEYLRRFGFIPSPTSSNAGEADQHGYLGERSASYRAGATYSWKTTNPDGLPVGFARLTGTNPVTRKPIDAVGFTCAACHTGQLEYEGTSILVDGGPAMMDLGKFRKALGLALAYTKYIPGRFGRFADAVLGEDHSSEQRAALKAELSTLLKRGQALNKLTKPVLEDDPRNVEEGYTRLDALNRIGNEVFFRDTLVWNGDAPSANLANLAPMTAPVNFPHIWSTPWFNWVQYDASIKQPMIRNAGESLGVSAKLNVEDGEDLYKSTAAIKTIYELEQSVAGEPPFDGKPGFKGLLAPRWPEEILGKIDTAASEQGQTLYKELCQNCHLPSVRSTEFWRHKRWSKPDRHGRRYLDLPEIKVEFLGTDPAQAEVLVERTVHVPAYFGIMAPAPKGADARVLTQPSFALALGAIVEKTADRWYDDHKIKVADRERMSGYRPNELQAKMIYKARPLDGIWATAPYLHNGSVPNLWELLSPVEDRSERFYLGSRLFDPEKVGYRTESFRGGFELDTRKRGNWNTGHEFKDGPMGQGVVGRFLPPEERWALIEYLKGL